MVRRGDFQKKEDSDDDDDEDEREFDGDLHGGESSSSSSGNDWPEEADDSADEDFTPQPSPKKPKARGKRKAARPSAAVAKNPQTKRSRKKRFTNDMDGFIVEDEDDVVEASTRKSLRSRARIAKQPMQWEKESDNEEDNKDIRDQNDHGVLRLARTQRRKHEKLPRTPRRHIQDSDDDSSNGDLGFPVGSSGRPPTRRPRRSNSTSSKPVASHQETDHDDDDDDDKGGDQGNHESSEESEGETLSRKRPTRSSATRATQRIENLQETYKSDDDNDDSEAQNANDKDRNPPRRPYKIISPTKKSSMSSDEEFLADSASENSEDQAVFDNSYSDDDDDVLIDEYNKGKSHHETTPTTSYNVDEEQIGSIDEDSSDEDETPQARGTSAVTPTQRTPGTPTTPRSITNRLDEIQPSQPGYDEDSSEDDNPLSSHVKNAGRSLPKLPPCPSTEDAITNEKLPLRHVCFISPDGNSRQCFALETLRQITLKAAHLPFRVGLDGSAQDTFLQPPHFRTAMSDDLLDQIASRFSREALDLHGDFYKRGTKENLREAIDSLRNQERNHDSVQDLVDIFGPEYYEQSFDDEDFLENVQRYMNSQMGSRDIYACPLCYSETHRRMIKIESPNTSRRGRRKLRKAPPTPVGRRKIETSDEDGDSDSQEEEIDDEEFLHLAADSEYDPMTVLGWMDNNRFEAASMFCFGRVSNLKKHLQKDHRVTIAGIQGNDLYQRYRVRAQDGLLQRFLHKTWRRYDAVTFHGAMQSYWLQGNNQNFVYLLDMMKRAQRQCEFIEQYERAGNDEKDSADEDNFLEAERYVGVGRDFFESFQTRAKIEWEQIISPFTKRGAKEDLRDFLADDGEGEEEDETPYFLTHRQLVKEVEDYSDPNHLVNKLQRKYAENPAIDNDYSSQEEGDTFEQIGSSSEDADDDSVMAELQRKGYYSEEEEEKDDWVKSIQSKRRRSKSKSSRRPGHSDRETTTTPIGKKITKRKASSKSSPTAASAIVSEPVSASTKRRLMIAESSSDEE